MKKTVIVFALGILSLTMTGCNQDRINRLEKENGELQEKIAKRDMVADYDLQAKCSKDAREWFARNKHKEKNTDLLEFNNHYSRTRNKCFILVEEHYHLNVIPGESSLLTSVMLTDVYENNWLGGYGDSDTRKADPKSLVDERMTGCEVNKQVCHSRAEFNALISPFMTD